MLGNASDRKPSPGRRLAAATLLAGLAAAAPARAGERLWDTVLEKLTLKAPPPGQAPGFVERTRPDPADLGYLPTELPHKVSPVPVKTAAQIQAQKDALDAAKARQLDSGAPKPLQVAKDKKPIKAPSGPAIPD